VIDVVQYKAHQNGVTIHFTPLFSNDDYNLDMCEMIEYEKIKNNLLTINENIKNHPLLEYAFRAQQHQILPKICIGDQIRLQQVVFSIL
jgi:hypothetical protein